MSDLHPRVRPTAVLIEDGRLLIVKQKVSDQRHWSLPGGALEYGETVAQCLVRETKEETGLDVKVKDLLYICDRFRHLDHHIVHMTFLVERVGDRPVSDVFLHEDVDSGSHDMMREVRLVPIEELPAYGFSPTFLQLVQDGFPDRGYKGDFHVFYGERQ